jgi:hypothetical protein
MVDDLNTHARRDSPFLVPGGTVKRTHARARTLACRTVPLSAWYRVLL